MAAVVGDELLTTEHDYTDRIIRLHFRWCRIEGEPRALLGQQIQWVRRDQLRDLDFPPADRELIDLLSETGHGGRRR